MIPIGYMAKIVVDRPDWLKADNVTSIYSVANCLSDDFGDYIEAWKHNGYWLFDSPSILKNMAKEKSITLEGTKLFYYETYELEFDHKTWQPHALAEPVQIDVEVPVLKEFNGYDVVTFNRANQLEHSPMSCNSMAEEIPANQYCLLHKLDDAKEYITAGKFKGCEPGVYRIVAVHSVPWL